METLKEIDAAESARRTKAYKFGRAKDEQFSAQGALKNLLAKLAAPEPDVDALKQIVALAPKIPSGITTVGTRLTPGGQNLQELLIREVSGALAILADTRKALEGSLPAARQRVAQAEARLATFSE